MQTDPIADMLTRIRNAVTAKHTRVDMPASRIKADIARILQDEGYIQGFKLLEDQPNPVKGLGPIRTLRRGASRPRRRPARRSPAGRRGCGPSA